MLAGQGDLNGRTLIQGQVTHLVDGEIGGDLHIAEALGLQRRPVERAQELEPGNAHLETVGAARRDPADGDLLGPQAHRHRLAFGQTADAVGAVELHGAKAHRCGAGDDARKEVHDADEIADEPAHRVAVDLDRRTDLLDGALVHDDDAVGHGQRLFLVVCDHDGGDAEPAVKRLDLLAEKDADLGVKRRQRLVEEQQAGRGGQGAGQRHALLLAAGKLGRILASLVAQADQIEELGDPFPDRGLAHALVHQPVTDVLRYRKVGKQGIGLEHDAEVTLRRRQIGNVLAALLDPPARLDVEPGDGAQQRRLAASRRAEKANELALINIEGNVPERHEIAELLGDVLDFQVARPLVSAPRRGLPSDHLMSRLLAYVPFIGQKNRLS